MKGEVKAGIVSVALAILVWILIFQGLSSLPEEPAPEPSTPQKTFALAEASYVPDLNYTCIIIDNISGKGLYNVTLISEFGEVQRLFPKIKAGEELPEPDLVVGDRLSTSFLGKISKLTVQYSFEPGGEMLEETLEWTW